MCIRDRRGLDKGQLIFYSSGTAVALASIREQQRRGNRYRPCRSSRIGKPEDEDGKTREEVVKTEIENNDNNNLTIPQVVNRLGMVFFLLFFNLGICLLYTSGRMDNLTS